MAIHDLKTQIARLPEQPGVYLYFNQAGDTVYVGKARALRDRVRSYLGAWGSNPRTNALLEEIARLEVIVTDSVMEALALENNLIKQRSPKYNILLRDDKNYPYLQLTTGERFPRVLVARRVEKDGHVYAGPFLPARLARRTMALTHRLFGIRSCNEVITGKRGRPCLEYDIHRCIAPCVDTICSEAGYGRAVQDTRLFLAGRTEELAGDLRIRMAEAAAAERFEQAGQLRDALRTVQTLVDRHQKMAAPDLSARDVFGLKLGPAGAVVQIFQVRGGRVVDRVELVTEASEGPLIGEADVVAAAIAQFYEETSAPPEVHVPVAPDEAEALEALLAARAGRRVRIVVPRRGEKRGLLDLASRNASLAYEGRFNAETLGNYSALETLRAVLALPALPRRIDCFDISTIQGSDTVASMVVCVDGRMKKGEYRKFKVTSDELRGTRTKDTESTERFLDDFAAMKQVVQRRYARVVEQGGPFPDLIVIDGGKGQLSAAYEALESLGLANLVAVGLAKKEELVFTRDHSDPIVLPVDDPALLLLQRIRDQAHRFAVTFHRQRRAKRDLRSELDGVPGVGPRRRRQLLQRFGSLTGVRRATREELEPVVGAKAADAILRFFAG
ncbi:MAG: excinuclease ABC subunit UvrC [Vicinamibacteria bacterium]|nr:excinuclease ABC subunit UvrC [Vicinamibacteria bacterium]